MLHGMYLQRVQHSLHSTTIILLYVYIDLKIPTITEDSPKSASNIDIKLQQIVVNTHPHNL